MDVKYQYKETKHFIYQLVTSGFKRDVSGPNDLVIKSPDYTPGIYADGYIVFAFPFVCSFVH